MTDQEKSVREELMHSPKHGYERIALEERLLCEEYCRDYKNYIDVARTERECVKEAVRQAEEAGFVPFPMGSETIPGPKIYRNLGGKALILAVLGEKPLSEGVNIAAAHIDSPRLDLKQIPLYEDGELAYLKTHYYGGIKKYQWTAMPLELHGTVILKNGESIDVVIGREENDPAFVITDLLPHLAGDQMKKTLSDAFPGESLNILVGSVPYADDGTERVKLAVLSILNDQFGITEEDFLSAEFEAVPSLAVRDLGLDRSLIGAYGHDDRSCAYAEFKALLDTETPQRTAVCILADKEETGSEGVSGMQSKAFEHFMEDLCDASGAVKLRRCFEKSFCISADVCNAYDPNYPDVSEKRNAARMNYGMGICKFTGSRGKSSTNDAAAETVAVIRKIFDDNKVAWQMAELGKVDQGGGGTIAMYMSRRNIETIDAGVPLLSMHAPYEVAAKFDCYMTYKGVHAFYKDR